MTIKEKNSLFFKSLDLETLGFKLVKSEDDSSYLFELKHKDATVLLESKDILE